MIQQDYAKNKCPLAFNESGQQFHGVGGIRHVLRLWRGTLGLLLPRGGGQSGTLGFLLPRGGG